MDTIPCAGCEYHRHRTLPIVGQISGCINKNIDPLTYMRLNLRGGVCGHRR